ncbi:hypothetical protein PHMEG_00033291, partial [Phytophthora megakarya]
MWKKKEVVGWIENVGDRVSTRAARHFNPGTARRWWRQRVENWEAAPAQMGVAGVGRKPVLENLEGFSFEAIVLRRLKKKKVTHEWITAQAIQFYSDVSDGRTRTFEASPNGMIYRFVEEPIGRYSRMTSSLASVVEFPWVALHQSLDRMQFQVA